MPGHQPPIGRTHRAGSKHELALTNRQNLRTDNPSVGRPTCESEDGDKIEKTGTEDGDDCDHQQNERHGEPQVDQPHDDIVQEAAVEARNDSGRHADESGDAHRSKSDDEGHSRAVDQPAQDIAPELIGSQKVLAGSTCPERRLQSLVKALLERVGQDEGRQDCSTDHQQQHSQSQHRGWALEQAPRTTASARWWRWAHPIRHAERARGKTRVPYPSRILGSIHA